jgi:acyl transferase domain-containing protein
LSDSDELTNGSDHDDFLNEAFFSSSHGSSSIDITPPRSSSSFSLASRHSRNSSLSSTAQVPEEALQAKESKPLRGVQFQLAKLREAQRERIAEMKHRLDAIHEALRKGKHVEKSRAANDTRVWLNGIVFLVVV